MKKPNRPSPKEGNLPGKLTFPQLRSKIFRCFQVKFPKSNDRCTHGPQLTCSQCKYSSFDGGKYCPKMYQHYITPGEVENSKKSILHRLPPEIVLLIVQHLKPFELECLRYVCRLFYHNYPTTRLLTTQGKFELQCLLEREPGLKKMACRMCWSKRHDKSMFYPLDWDQNPHYRKCKRYRRGLLQFCPYQSASFDDVVLLSKSSNQAYQFPKCSHDAFDMALALQERPCLFQDETWTIVRWGKCKVLTTTTLVAIYPSAKIPSIADAERAFLALDIPLCPHLHLGDPCVIKQYRPDLVARHKVGPLHQFNTVQNCCCLHCRGFKCRFCDSRFRFRVHVKKEPLTSTCIGVLIMRNLGKLKDPNDPCWLRQLSVTKLPEFRTQWSDRIVAMCLNSTVGIPQGDVETTMLSRVLENKANSVLKERDGWTTAPLGNLPVGIRNLHKPLWKPPLSRQDKNFWHW